MRQTSNNTLQLTPTQFSGYSVPIQGPLGIFADHTFVYGMTAPPSEFSCHGVHRPIPATPPGSITTGDLHEVLAMVNGNAVTRNPPVYNDPTLDMCGIAYATDGVCHQVANRILFTGGTIAYSPFNQNNVRGLTLSTMIYGVFGKTTVPMMTRLDAAINAALAAGFGHVRGLKDESDIKDLIINRILDSKELDSNLLVMILDELYLKSTTLKRVNTILTHVLGDNISSEKMMSIESAVKELDEFMESDEIRIASKYHKVENILVDKINQKIRSFDKFLYKELGTSDYKRVFQYEYDEHFSLCEPQDNSAN